MSCGTDEAPSTAKSHTCALSSLGSSGNLWNLGLAVSSVEAEGAILREQKG